MRRHKWMCCPDCWRTPLSAPCADLQTLNFTARSRAAMNNLTGCARVLSDQVILLCSGLGAGFVIGSNQLEFRSDAGQDNLIGASGRDTPFRFVFKART